MGSVKRNQHLNESIEYKYNYIYEIKIISGRSKGHYYIGQHSTDNLNDNYLGSGKLIYDWFRGKKRVEGVDYIKRIICFCDTLEELNDCEWYYIYNRYETDPMCWNRRAGGDKQGIKSEVIEKQKQSNKIWCENHHKELSERASRAGKTRYSKQEEHDKTARLNHEAWTRYTEEEYKVRCQGLQDAWDNKTEEQRKVHRDHVSEGVNKWFANMSEEDKDKRNKTISDIQIGSIWMTSTFDEHIYYVIPTKQDDFYNRGYYRCVGRTHREPYVEKVIKNEKLSVSNKGAMYMTKPGDKVRYVIQAKQPEFILNGYCKCKKNGEPITITV